MLSLGLNSNLISQLLSWEFRLACFGGVTHTAYPHVLLSGTGPTG